LSGIHFDWLSSINQQNPLKPSFLKRTKLIRTKLRSVSMLNKLSRESHTQARLVGPLIR